MFSRTIFSSVSTHTHTWANALTSVSFLRFDIFEFYSVPSRNPCWNVNGSKLTQVWMRSISFCLFGFVCTWQKTRCSFVIVEFVECFDTLLLLSVVAAQRFSFLAFEEKLFSNLWWWPLINPPIKTDLLGSMCGAIKKEAKSVKKSNWALCWQSTPKLINFILRLGETANDWKPHHLNGGKHQSGSDLICVRLIQISGQLKRIRNLAFERFIAFVFGRYFHRWTKHRRMHHWWAVKWNFKRCSHRCAGSSIIQRS